MWIEIDGERILFSDCLILGGQRVLDEDHHLYLLKHPNGRCIRLEDGRASWLNDEQAIALATELGVDWELAVEPLEPPSLN
ncbi:MULTISPECIES: hypothetical protein [unclassified Mesorhizobium]|uniref:hypothetical protein n=1 Tax=unclassified Mesorhizobium TaxID=325217 RepID=UPI000FCB6124|nr:MULTISPECIES: hypothetical protein [unclassified Mesorhizobium]TGV88231.1 hypothetical protein EN801_022555 [Mesorhizobium sp. M00.F.Ca.ET.158.01.1.1]MCT2577689.1 hypothetical protein [Mesorhizobium sp. P13.3]MDF3166627.1 hypothetical protein [Mesorhizobium sp. P16.1]MDF3179369.1 hypothetical protein [Mesorhizobium sp. P17.1]MDF3183261.1 hypothetical protein [Mesorhizobium sp. ICCV3110.1]